MSTQAIDLNADLGEHPTSQLDEQIMPYISSCSIACGGHVGDEKSVRKTIQLAKKWGVAVGAHPSYPDKENFGRKVMEISSDSLCETLSNQIELVWKIACEEGVKMHHVKPHGALYNQAAQDKHIATLVVNVIKEVNPDMPYMGFANSESEIVARQNCCNFIAEGFADRRYEPSGALRSRALSGAVLAEEEVLTQVQELVINQRVWAGQWIPLGVQSICLHGDTKGAVFLAKNIHNHLVSKGIRIVSV